MAMQEHCDDELISSTDAFYLKTRKPYTITKQREKWTEAEHDKFVEALKLYGRAWRRIEEHVGTKTAVQIRSHAQKFFTKVARDYGASADKSIEIPPPRPKRKPMHPYPRKIVIPDAKEIAYAALTGVEDEDNRSPTSVLLAHDSEGLVSMASNSPNSSSADYQHSPTHELSFHTEESSCPDAETKQSFKLFGKIFVVGDYNSSTSSDDSEDVQKSDPEMHSVRSSSSSSSENAETSLTQQLVLEFKRSERSAFSQLKSSVIEMKNNKGFKPYKKRVKVEETTASVKMSYPWW